LKERGKKRGGRGGGRGWRERGKKEESEKYKRRKS